MGLRPNERICALHHNLGFVWKQVVCVRVGPQIHTRRRVTHSWSCMHILHMVESIEMHEIDGLEGKEKTDQPEGQTQIRGAMRELARQGKK